MTSIATSIALEKYAAACRAAIRGPVRAIERTRTDWVLVDLGDALVHIMQPAIRAYYNLEEIWGDKPVALRSPAAAPVSRRTATPDLNDKVAAKAPAKKIAKKTAAPRKVAKKTSAAATKRPKKRAT